MDSRLLGQRRRSLAVVAIVVGGVLLAARLGLSAQAEQSGLDAGLVEGAYVRVAAVLLAALWLVAVVGFGLRYRR